jgi:hypothetical protein
MPEPIDGLANRIVAVGSDPICAAYRFEIPLRAMIARSWCTAMIYGALGSFEVPPGSALLTQRHIALGAPIVSTMHDNGCSFVHDIDDLLWALPADNPNARALTPQLLDEMDASLRLADMVTTSTEPLAAALEARGIPAVIIPNVLDRADWQVQPKRAERSRLRVGWYGQRNVHVDDLNIVENVVNALAGEVDFVFYGDLPRGLVAPRAEIERYSATAIELFPAMLAMLDLDILLSPLAQNPFNECKSNLRLLQAGMLGYAAIATDIDPHRTLPVTLVDNAARNWIHALRERVGEVDAVRAEGRALRAAVEADYLIDDRRAEQIFTTWTGRAPQTSA